MKRRLRKKKRLGEFRCLGIYIVIKLKNKDYSEIFWRDFILEAVEANNCFFGGGGNELKLEGFIELGYFSDDPRLRLRKIKRWLESRNDILNYEFGNIVDASHL